MTTTISKYHVFADNKDNFFTQDQLEQAVQLYQQYVDEGEPNVRLSKESYENEDDYANDTYEEVTLLSTGGFPL